MTTATATETRTDEEIQRDVLNELKFEPRVQPNEIGVVVKDGVVALTGWVDSYAKKWAAEEAVRQLRLRDIGGIIVIDFIDMARARNRDKVLTTLRKALDADKSKSYVVEVSPLGLVEMTRQNVTDGVRDQLPPTPEVQVTLSTG